MGKTVLIISNYYPPEMGAAANRIQTLAQGLQSRGFKVSVLCPLPNYPYGKIFEGYPKTGLFLEQIDAIHVVRLATYATKSTNPYKRFKAMSKFANGVKRYLKNNPTPEQVIIQCPPLLVAYAALKVLKQKRVKTIVNISDLWPLAAVELGALKKGLIYKWMLRMESYIYNNADHLLGQSNEILEHIRLQNPEASLQRYRNYPNLSSANIASGPGGNVKLIYAGLLGAAQGILDLCKGLELPENWELHIYGNGNEAEALKMYLKGCAKAITYHGTVTKKILHEQFSAHNLALVPLRTRIYGSVPSKIFELAHFGLPVLYLGSGEAATIITQNNLGWVVDAMDFKGLNSTLKKLDITRENWPKPDEIKQLAQQEFIPEPQILELIKQLN